MLECIEFKQENDRLTNRVSITQIQMCMKGLRLVEGSITDESILF